MAAALEENLATPNAQFYCSGSMGIGRRTIHCAHGARHGDETATDVIKNSCNVASAQLALRLGKKKLYEYEKMFGFGESPARVSPARAVGFWRRQMCGPTFKPRTSGSDRASR
jgi:stage V sporulation protein D (sporulation-specific penicillin-binding protein)